MDFSPEILRPAAELFFEGGPDGISLLSSSEREEDVRAAVLAVKNGQKSVVKLASNAFTTSRRIESWRTLIRETRSLGVYAPDLIPSVKGRLSEEFEIDGRRFVVWREEFAPYPFAQTQEEYGKDSYKEKDATRPRSEGGAFPAWQEELILFYASLGAKRLTGFPGPSGYARLTPFDGEKTDEVEECVLAVEENIRTDHPALLSRWEGIRSRWNENRDALAALYPRLPSSVFQADWNDTNVLLTKDGHFAGLIDCNLAGEDKVLNMALSVGYCGFNASPGGRGEDLKRTAAVLALFAEKYRWTPEEIEAAPLLWRYMTALYWGEVEDVGKAQNDGEAAAVLDRIEAGLEETHSFGPFMSRAVSRG